MDTLKEKLKDAKLKLVSAQQYYNRLKLSCVHPISRMIKHENKATCDICGDSYGVWCDQSPDHACHYVWEIEETYITLCDGSDYHPMIKDITKYTESEEDICIFCGRVEGEECK